MNLLHLHLHVRDRNVSERFYQDWFGLRIARKGEHITFLSDGAGFDLALAEDPEPAAMPAWFHFGFRLESSDEIRDLLRRMERSHVPIVKALYIDDTFASFRASDPDGYSIEIYWEAADAPLD